ncbi:hypothetical protein G6011_02644 [Alternaria panax]|uniref:Uncharacterized protein n=1 Tax=Alternaria panax TaxID=48097 RepID=A0AAD4I538_9PLEO|nr:hypothetical protein G6011_02644 [Alternaria panax]
MASPRTTSIAQSPLLSLPGEVRNQIYAFVLSTSPRDHIDFSRTSNDRHFNQLRLACCQLYKETQLLELKLNPVKINGHALHAPESLLDDKDPMKAKRVLLNLTRLLGPERLSWITSLTPSNQVPVQDGDCWEELAEMASTMLQLADVLRSNPALRVKYNMHTFCRTSLLKHENSKFLDILIMYRGIMASSVIRDETLEHMWPTTASMESGVVARSLSSTGNSSVFQALRQAPLDTKQLWKRIRFFPNPDIVTAESFVLSPTSSLWVQRVHAQGRLEIRAPLFKRWIEEGM